MEPIAVSTAACGPTGTKRTASPTLSCKRRRTSDERLKESKNDIVVNDSLIPACVSKRESMAQLQEQLSTRTLLQAEKMDELIDGKTAVVQTNQYCQFTIQVGGLDTTINVGVPSEFQTILLRREWIQNANLLSGSDDHRYYILVPLNAEAANGKFPDVSAAQAKSKDSKEIEMERFDEIDEKYNIDKDEDLLYEEFSSDDNTLSSPDLSSRGSDDRNSLVGDELSWGEASSGDEEDEEKAEDEEDEEDNEDGEDEDEDDEYKDDEDDDEHYKDDKVYG